MGKKNNSPEMILRSLNFLYSIRVKMDMWVSESHSVLSSSLRPHGLYSPPDSSVPGILQARIYEWGLSLLQRIFPTQESNWGLLHCSLFLYQLSYQGSPKMDISKCKTKWKNRFVCVCCVINKDRISFSLFCFILFCFLKSEWVVLLKYKWLL